MAVRIFKAASAGFLSLVMLIPAAARADGTDCVIYATDYANAHVGSGDVVGDVLSGGMAGSVLGGEWAGASGAARGARAGGALGVLNNLGSLPGGWQTLYDTAYHLCLQQNSGLAAVPLAPAVPLPPPSPNCRSSARVNSPFKRTPEGGIIADSSFGDCN